MPSGYFRSAFSKGAKSEKTFPSSSEPSYVEEEDKDKTQRFTDDTLGKPIRYTAKRHSFSLSPSIERKDSGDAARPIPGAFPPVQKTWFELEQLPTTEHPSGSRVGVGSLPGTINESSVALLPEEREHPDPYLSGNVLLRGRQYRDESPFPLDGRELPTIERAFRHKNTGRRYVTRKPLEVDRSELPTLERPSGSKVGVGSLPGSNYEVGVAVLPEERLHPDPIVGDVGLANFSQPKHKVYKRNKHLSLGGGEHEPELPTQERPSGSRVGIGSMPRNIHEAGVATLPEERVEGRPYGTRHTGFEEHLEKPPSRKNKTRSAQRSATYPSTSKTQSKSKSKYDLPTTEEPSTSRVGIGSMPGSIHEAGVATLPEERIDGRPYGSGHTGFEDTLGHGHTFRPTHSTGGETSKSKTKSQSKSKTTPKHATAQIVTDAAAKQYLMEQNPISFASSHPHETSNASVVSSSGKEKLPEDTIFSATQRAKKKDPSFTHGKLDFAERPEVVPATEVQGDTYATSKQPQRGPTVEAQARPAYTGPSVLETVEGAALGAMHSAENVFYRVGDSARAFVPEIRLPRLVGFGDHSSGGSATKRSVVSDSEHPLDTNGTSNRGKNPSLGATSHRVDEFALPEDKDITDAAQSNNTISGQESRLPQVIQREYYKNPAEDSENNYDLFGDRLDFNQFVYEDDESYKGPSIPSSVTIPNENHEGRFSEHDNEKDSLQYGRGGVAFSMAPGKDGTLPGYPTQEGMNKLIGERMRDDHLRAAGAKNPFKTQSDTAAKTVDAPVTGIATSNVFDHYAMSECYSREKQETPIVAGVRPCAADKYDAAFRDEPEESPIESDISRRNLREKREVPIFKGGKPAASGEYEAVFREEEHLPAQFDESRHIPQEMREIPVSNSGEPTAVGKYEAVCLDGEFFPLDRDISTRNLEERREVPFFTSGNREQEPVFRDNELLPRQPDFSDRGPIEDQKIPDFESAKPIAASDFEAAYRDTLRDDKSLFLDPDKSKKEKREAAVFKPGKSIAPGEYESVFNDESLLTEASISNRHPQEKSSFRERPTTLGKFEAVYNDEELPPPRISKIGNMNTRHPDTAPPSQPQQQPNVTSPPTKGGSGFAVGFLGKAISPEQEVIETERARRAAIRRMAIN